MLLRPALFSSLLLAAACGGGNDNSGECAGGKCDDLGDAGEGQDPSTFACQVSEAVNLHDPLAEFIIKPGTTCPSNYKEVIAKLDEFDTADCQGPSNGTRTTLVSDGARLINAPESYRTVTTRSCGGRGDHGIFFTLLSVRPDSKSENFSFMEMMAFDPVSGLFNYYTQSGGSWTFEGNSLDILRGGASCSSCHPSGGPIMKELEFPWVHWDATDPLPGADQVFASMPELGQRTSAADLEQVMKAGNKALNQTRVRKLVEEGDVRELLRPLFCQIEINLDTGGEQLNTPMTRVPADFLLDPNLVSGAQPIPMAADVYTAAITAANQSVPGFSNQDTEFAFIFPERANVDNVAVAELVEAGVIDQELVRDVLSIDFTRALYSDERCGLLEQVPTELAEINPGAIRQGLIERLDAAAPGAGTPGADLLARLRADDGDDHVAAANAFLAACRARPAAALMNDLLAFASDIRDNTANRSIIENSAQLTRTTLNPPAGAHLDPVTCELVGD